MIRIITDSSAEFSAVELQQLNIDSVPLTVAFEEEVFRDRIDLTPARFYEKLKTSHFLPKTSQPSPDSFTRLFSKYLDQGDEIVGIFLSSKISGTFQSACIAAQPLDNSRIFLVDSKNGSLGLNVLVREAVKMRALGHTAREIRNGVTALSKRTQIIVMVETLQYLKKGGRISAAAAVAGGMMGIKPIVASDDGEVKAIGKARGQKGAFQFIAEHLKKLPPDLHRIMAFGHSCSPEAVKELARQLGVNLKQAVICEFGTTIGTYAGPGAVGVAYIARQEAL